MTTPIGTFNRDLATVLQLNDFSCSIGSIGWCLNSIGIAESQEALLARMVPGLVSTADGLLNATGATLATFLSEGWGLAAHNQSVVSFDEVAQRAGQQPLAIGGRSWFGGIGHWVAVRGFDGERLLLANPGGTGPNFGQQSLNRGEFDQRGPFAAVWIDLDGTGTTTTVGARTTMIVANTGGSGLNVRQGPDAGSDRMGSLVDGTTVDADEHVWRRVHAGGLEGWIADEFLVPAGGQFRVANTGGSGLNVRRAPDVNAARVGGLDEGALVDADEHAWRRIRAGGLTGWVAAEFLTGATG